MEVSLVNRLIEILQPHMGDLASRKALLKRVLSGCAVVDQIDWSGPPATFTTALVGTLVDFGACSDGQLAIVRVLEGVRDETTRSKQHKFATLISLVKSAQSPTFDEPAALDFLIETGNWAKSKLKACWRLKQQQIDLSEERVVRPVAASQFKIAMSEQGEIAVVQALNKLRLSRDAIDYAYFQLEVNVGEGMRHEITQAEFEQEYSRCQAIIKKGVGDIEAVLESLDLGIVREAIE